MTVVNKALADYRVTASNVIPELAAAFNNAHIPQQELKAGVELEVGFINKDGSLPSNQQHSALEQAINRRIKSEFSDYSPDEFISVEPCTFVLEVKTPPFKPQEAAKMLALIQRLEQIVDQERKKLGLIQLPFSAIPHLTADQIITHLIGDSPDAPGREDRTRNIVKAMEHAFDTNNATWSFASISTQLTFGTKDASSHVMMQRLTTATAVLRFAVTDNSPPIIFGDDAPLAENPAQQMRHRIGQWRQVAKNAFYNESTAAFFTRWLTDHFTKPLLSVVEPDGSYTPTIDGVGPTYMELITKQPQKYGQLLTVQGALKERWAHSKLQAVAAKTLPHTCASTLPSLEEVFSSLLLEVRDGGVGRATGLPMLIYLQLPMAFDPIFQAYLIDTLKNKYGIDLNDDADLAAAFEVIEQNAKAARKRQYLNDSHYALHAPYGAHGHTLQEFMKELSAQLYQSHVRLKTDLEHLTQTWDELHTTCMTDAQLYRDTLRTPQECHYFMTNCRNEVFNHSGETTMYHHYKNGMLPKLPVIPIPYEPAEWELIRQRKFSIG